jgi:type IV fimbrial biogenesis protein FimT
MKNAHKHAQGRTLLELMIGAAMVAVLLGLALPSFSRWSRNLEVRNAAESVTNGIQKARAEAVARNTNVTFVLDADSSWDVAVVSPVTAIESRTQDDGSRNTSLTLQPVGATTLTFNNLGLVVPNADASPSLSQVDVSVVGGDKNLRVLIAPGGSSRMCDPSIAAGSNARAC